MTAQMLLENGHRVVAGIRGGQPRLESLATESPEMLKALQAGTLRGLDLHMEKPESWEGAEPMIRDALLGRLDVLINNAGYGLLGPVEMHTEEELREQMEVCFFGPALLMQKMLPHLRRSRGKIINVSSICGRVAYPFYGSYCASKFALEAYSESLAMDLERSGVQVALVEPGGFKTEFTKKILVGAHSKGVQSPYRERVEKFEAFIRTRGQKLSGDPSRVAKTIAHLAQAKRIPLRVVCGRDAWAMTILNRIFPDAWRIAFLKFIYRLGIYQS